MTCFLSECIAQQHDPDRQTDRVNCVDNNRLLGYARGSTAAAAAAALSTFMDYMAFTMCEDRWIEFRLSYQ